ncbi:MAG: hypothetical protein JXO22_05245 [Phycisphaerae bacterium]|nr:hypothetical protein [Phycisphaerae bacterium]
MRTRNTQRTSHAAIALLAILLVSVGASADVLDARFYQIDFMQGADTLIDSDWGTLVLEFDGAPDFQYLNLVVDGMWRIQNIPVWSLQGPSAVNQMSFNFPLGTPAGVDVPMLVYSAELTAEPLFTAPGGVTTDAFVEPRSVTIGGLGGPVGPLPPATPLIGWIPVRWSFNDGFNDYNQDVGVDECVPGAFSNSLSWLDAINPALSIPEGLKSVEGLKEPTGWVPPAVDDFGDPIPGTGGTGVDAWQGKGAALAGYVTTRYFDISQADSIFDELDDDQDVELWGDHHAAVVSGMVQHADGTYTIYVTHDTKQGEDGGTVTEPITYNPTTGDVTGGAPGFFSGSPLRGFVVECPVEPTETTYTFSQIDFEQGADTVMDSDWGTLALTFEGTPDFQFVNLSVDGIWVIQDVCVYSFEGPGTMQTQLLNFPLGNPPGMDVMSINYAASLTPAPLGAPPADPPIFGLVTGRAVTVGGLDGPIGYIPPPFPITGWLPDRWSDNYEFASHNQEVGVDECVPGAFSNSLQSLDEQNDHIDIPADKKSVEGLKGPTGFTSPTTGSDGKPTPGTGGTGVNAWQGKRDSVKQWVTTRYFDISKIDNVFDEIDDDQDVELWGHHHAAMVVGMMKHPNGKYSIQVAHDTKQGQKGGTAIETITYDPATGAVEGGSPGFFSGSMLRGFVVECPRPPGTVGDANGDGVVDVFDIDAFVLAITNPELFELLYPDADISLCDTNGDGVVDVFDIDSFVELIVGGGH